MTAEALPGWFAFLRTELTVNSTRGIRMTRMTVCASLLITVYLVFRMPMAAYGAYIFLMASQRDAVSSITLSVGALVGATSAIAFSILLYMLDIDEPALRVPAMAVVMFGGMYLSRAPRIGPLFMIAGFILVVTQTIVDQIPDAETLTHLLLWLALVVLCACTTVSLSELMAGSKPSAVFADGLKERTARAAACFSGTVAYVPSVSASELAGLAARLGPPAIRRLAAALQLEQIASLRSEKQTSTSWQNLAARVMSSANGGANVNTDTHAMPITDSEATLYRAALDATRQLENPSQDTGTPLPVLPDHLLPDQSTHIQSARFAFKATLAAMLCYILYSALDWNGIRTSIITCFFVALSSTGETVHKLSLRLTGALIGGLLAAFSIVFLFPVIDDIGGFIVLFAAVTLLCVWVATASPLIAYAGLQMAFAFYLGVLQDTGPTDDLTVLRDRIVGIVLGNVAMSVVFSTLWPVSTLASAKAVLARIARRQARLLDIGQPVAAVDIVAGATDLEQASRLARIAAFDLGLTPYCRAQRPTLATPMSRMVAWSNAWLRYTPVTRPAPHAARRLEGVAQYLEDHRNAVSPAMPDATVPVPLNKVIEALEQETIRAHS